LPNPKEKYGNKWGKGNTFKERTPVNDQKRKQKANEKGKRSRENPETQNL